MIFLRLRASMHISQLGFYVVLICFCQSIEAADQDQGNPMKCRREDGQTELPQCIFIDNMALATPEIIFSFERKEVIGSGVHPANFQYEAHTFKEFYHCLRNHSNDICTTNFEVVSNFKYTAKNTSTSPSVNTKRVASSLHWTCNITQNFETELSITCKRDVTEEEICSKTGTCLLIGLEEEDEPVQIQWLFPLYLGVGHNDYQCDLKMLRIHFTDNLICAQRCDCPVLTDNNYCKIRNTLLKQNDITNTSSANEESTNNAMGYEKSCKVTKTKNSGSDSTGAIVGAVLGILLVIIVIVIVVIIVRRRKINVREYFSKFTLCQMCPFIKKTSQLSHDEGRLSPYHVGDLQRDENNQTYNSAKSQRKTYEEVDVNYNAGVSANAHTNGDRNVPDDYERISHYKKAKHSTEDDKTIPIVSTNTTNMMASSDSVTGHSGSPDYFTHKYSHLHEEETKIPKNPYNVLLKPKEYPKQRQPIETPSDANIPSQESFKYSVALSIEDVENIRSQPIDVVDTAGTSKATPRKFHIKEKSGGTEMDGNLDNDPQNKDHKYFELEREDGTAESEANAKNKRRAYFELEKVEEEENSDPSDSYY